MIVIPGSLSYHFSAVFNKVHGRILIFNFIFQAVIILQ